MHVIRRLTLLAIGLFSVNSADAGADGVPNFFHDSPALTVPHIVLGRSCYSLRATSLDLACNPAQMATEDKRIFRVNLIANDRLNTVNDYRKQLEKDDSTSVAESLLNQNSQFIAKAASSIWYQHSWWAVGIVPVRAGIAYLRRNPAYPDISVHAFKEMELFGKVGLYSSEDERLRFGLQTRYLQREFVHQRFDALDAATNPDLVKVEKQRALYMEPGFVYSWKSDWEPEFSLMLSNIALYLHGAHMPTPPLIDVGFSSNVFMIENFRSTLHYTYNRDTIDFLHGLSWSGSYEYVDLFSTQLSLGAGQFAIGTEWRVHALTLGVAYRDEQMPVDRWTSHHVSSFTFELGLAF